MEAYNKYASENGGVKHVKKKVQLKSRLEFLICPEVKKGLPTMLKGGVRGPECGYTGTGKAC